MNARYVVWYGNMKFYQKPQSIESLEVDFFINYFQRRLTRHRVSSNVVTKLLRSSRFCRALIDLNIVKTKYFYQRKGRLLFLPISHVI